ncbi:hypothetical protein F3N42_03160 [Marinihelvus fidelis]|uniref:Sulfotransferase family protein n=1 Tax=Marinihelvus fidelis TaxID=2613842 RepID=A0A5N0TFG3_9GAMM|nr:hypothetical protein [Marinihelvus fidelis]KAA9133361.1 hypothetical protein F3N42_03160 [Marinihelvus fidelis]
MKKRLILHIGVHRTGTTSIQGWLHGNRKALLGQGVRYAFDQRMHTDIAWQLHTGKLSPGTLTERLLRDAADDRVHTLILSGEDFCVLRDPSILSGLRDHFEVTVVCYLRRQDSWLESWYNQHVKWPWDRALSQASAGEFIGQAEQFYWIDYAWLLAGWRNAFGDDNLRIRVFEREQLTGSLEEDFAALCGIDAGQLGDPVAGSNDSAPPEAIEFLRHLKLIDKLGDERLVVVRTVVNIFRRNGLAHEKHFWPAKVRREYAAQFADSNKEVATRYLGRADGAPLFMAPLPGTDETPPRFQLPAVPALYDTIVNPVVRRLLWRVLSLQDQAAEHRRHGRGRPVTLVHRLKAHGQEWLSRLRGLTGRSTDLRLRSLMDLRALPLRQRQLLRQALKAVNNDEIPNLDDPVDVTRRWVEPVISDLAARFHQARQAKQGQA